MLKFYCLFEEKKEYWEIWFNDDGFYWVYWGEFGMIGKSKVFKKSLFYNF